MTPPPATRSGLCEKRIIVATVSRSSGSAGGRRTCHTRASNSPVRHLEGLGGQILGEGDGYCTCLGRVGENPHGIEQRRRQLLASPYPIEISRDRAKAVVHRDVQASGVLELLQDWVGTARGEDVAGQEQHGNAISGRDRGAGHEVRRPWSDRSRAGKGAQPIRHAGKANRGVHHRLLIAGEVVREVIAGLQQRLSESGDIAVPEDAEQPAKKR